MKPITKRRRMTIDEQRNAGYPLRVAQVRPDVYHFEWDRPFFQVRDYKFKDTRFRGNRSETAW